MALFQFIKAGTVVDAKGHKTVGGAGQVADFDDETAAGAEDGLIAPLEEKPAKKGKVAPAKAAD